MGLMAKGIKVSMNSALTDVPARGVHVNVTEGKNKPIHVEVIGNRHDGAVADISYAPADPAARKLANAENPSRWNKIVAAVDDFVQKPKNAKKLANVADAAAQNFPDNTRNFDDTAHELKKICG